MLDVINEKDSGVQCGRRTSWKYLFLAESLLEMQKHSGR